MYRRVSLEWNLSLSVFINTIIIDYYYYYESRILEFVAADFLTVSWLILAMLYCGQQVRSNWKCLKLYTYQLAMCSTLSLVVTAPIGELELYLTLLQQDCFQL